jgi:hypothetical protein
MAARSSLDLLIEINQSERDAQLSHFDSLDTKAGLVLGFAGVLIGLGNRSWLGVPSVLLAVLAAGIPRSISTTSPEVSLEPVGLIPGERRAQFLTDLLLSKPPSSDRDRLAHRVAQLTRQSLQLLVGLTVDPDAQPCCPAAERRPSSKVESAAFRSTAPSAAAVLGESSSVSGKL